MTLKIYPQDQGNETGLEWVNLGRCKWHFSHCSSSLFMHVNVKWCYLMYSFLWQNLKGLHRRQGWTSLSPGKPEWVGINYQYARIRSYFSPTSLHKKKEKHWRSTTLLTLDLIKELYLFNYKQIINKPMLSSSFLLLCELFVIIPWVCNIFLFKSHHQCHRGCEEVLQDDRTWFT